MKEFIKVYDENQEDIEKFIITTLKNNGSILSETSNNYKKVFNCEFFPFHTGYYSNINMIVFKIIFLIFLLLFNSLESY